MLKTKINRRVFLRGMVIGTAGVVAVACTPATPTPTAAPPVEAPEEPTPAFGEAVTISYWHIWGGVRTEQCPAGAGRLYGGDARHQGGTAAPAEPGYVDKIITGLAGDAPDLTMAYIGDTLLPRPGRGALRPLDDLIQAGIADPLGLVRGDMEHDPVGWQVLRFAFRQATFSLCSTGSKTISRLAGST